MYCGKNAVKYVYTCCTHSTKCGEKGHEGARGPWSLKYFYHNCIITLISYVHHGAGGGGEGVEGKVHPIGMWSTSYVMNRADSHINSSEKPAKK